MPHHGTQTAPSITPTPTTATSAAPTHPRLGSVIRRVSLSLLIAFVVLVVNCVDRSGGPSPYAPPSQNATSKVFHMVGNS